jgi:hypothetical protein
MQKRKIPLTLCKLSSNRPICVNPGKRTNSLEASRHFRTKGKLLNTDFLKLVLAYPFLKYNSVVVNV